MFDHPSHYGRDAEKAKLRKAERNARLADHDAFPRPDLDLGAIEIDELGGDELSILADIFFIAHCLRTALDHELDQPSSNRMLLLREIALSHPKPSNLAVLARKLGVTRQCAGLVLKGMKEEELVVESRDPIDTRAKMVWLTKRGLRELRHARHAMERAITSLLRGVAPEPRARFMHMLRHIRRPAADLADNPRWARTYRT